MTRATLILGGARSGKSSYGESLALASGLAPVYLATARAGDGEMRARIARHRERRAGQGWRLVEEPTELAAALRREATAGTVVLVDCLSMWLSNLLVAGCEPEPPAAALLEAIDSVEGQLLLVSSEVGLGVVPATSLGRRFRDRLGELHQEIARGAGTVVMMVAGLPLLVKQDGGSDA